jgi:hypothetical protein
VRAGLTFAKWAFHKVTQKTDSLIKHTVGEKNVSVTEGQHQEDIARWGSQPERLESRAETPVGHWRSMREAAV